MIGILSLEVDVRRTCKQSVGLRYLVVGVYFFF